MTPRFLVAASLAILLAGCAMAGKDERASLAPASCGARDFNVYFEGQSIDLSDEARQVIDTIGDGLNGCTINHVRIIGSSDEIGADTTNEEVSKQRAKVMADYLVDHVGWSRDSMELLATGERGAVTDSGLNVPMRRRARIVVDAVAPS